MHSLIGSQVRSAPCGVLKVSGKRISQYSSSRHFFHHHARLRANTSTPSPTEPTASSDVKTGSKEKESRKSALQRQSQDSPAQSNTSRLKKAASAQEPSPQSPDNASSFYGSAFRRRQRNRHADEVVEPRSAPVWFVEHNVELREHIQQPNLRELARDRRKGYIVQDETNKAGKEPAEDPPSNQPGREETRVDLSGVQPELIEAARAEVSSLFGTTDSKASQTILEHMLDSRRRREEHRVGIQNLEAASNIEQLYSRSSVATKTPRDILSTFLSDPPKESTEGVASGSNEGGNLPIIEVSSHTPGSEGPPSWLKEVFTGRIVPPETGSTDTKSSTYYINIMQAIEIRRTAIGLMKLPRDKSMSVTEPAAQKSHLLLHYPAPGGDILLNSVVKQIALDLDCDLVTIDAHDLSDLISAEGLSQEITSEGRLLSYEVYCKEPEVPDPPPTFAEPFDHEDPEQPDENSIPHAQPFGTPVIIGKPITINLSDLMKGRKSQKASSGVPMLPQMLSKLFDTPRMQQEKSPSKVPSHMFAPLVESIISAAQQKTAQAQEGDSEQRPQSRRKGVLFHVKDLKPIQETAVGHQFLSELYDQVQRRRLVGDSMMIIGTESSQEWLPYSRDRIQDIERDEVDEISRTIVVTPVLPNHAAKKTLLQDKQRRTIDVNMRHLWSMMRLKDSKLFDRFEHGFWKRDFVADLHPYDKTRLKEQPMSFSQIHRLATVLAAADETLSFSKETSVIGDAHQLLAASDTEKYEWADEQISHSTRNAVTIPIRPAPRHENSRLAQIRNTATKYEKRLMSGIIESEKINTTFEDIHVPMETIDAVQTLTTLSLVRPDAFSYGVLASDKIPGLLLYGPPGTGKTLLAKAVAKESGATVLEVSAADINNMYVGEGEKNVQALFSLAKKLSPCIVFLDEADAMFSARARSGKRVSHRELLNQFLREWDGMSNDSGSAFIMVATNRPMDLDDAVLRRLPRRVLVDLPSEGDRLEILKIHLRNEQLAEDVNLSDMANRTPFYSGSDLKNLSVAAALNAVREEQEQAKAHQGDGEYKYPEKRTLTAVHFEKALEEITASISEDMSSLREIKKFDEQFGDKRGRKKKSPWFGFRDAKEADKVLDTVKVRS